MEKYLADRGSDQAWPTPPNTVIYTRPEALVDKELREVAENLDHYNTMWWLRQSRPT